MYPRFRVWASISLFMFMVAQPVFAQEGDEDFTNESPGAQTAVIDAERKPTYLKPVSDTADLNLLTQIFGDVARAAAGQISLADALIEYQPDSPTEIDAMRTDSVLSAVMYVYLLGIIGIVGFMIVIMSIVYLVQSGIDGELINKRYNEWVVIRVIYAVFSLMPVIGGWSIGQYGILNATFFVNSITNEMHHTANRWAYSHNSVTSVPLQGQEYKRLVENIYLSALCAEISNQFHESRLAEVGRKKDEYLARMEGKEVSHRTEAALSRFANIESYSSMFFDSSTFAAKHRITPSEIISATKPKESRWEVPDWAFPPPWGIIAESGLLNKKYLALSTSGKHEYSIGWGSPATAPDACGKVDFTLNVGGSLSGGGEGGGGDLNLGPRNKAFVAAYHQAHVQAIDELSQRAFDFVREARKTVEATVAANPVSVPYSNKAVIGNALDDQATSDKLVDAIGNAFSVHATSSQLSWEELITGETGRFTSQIRKAYSENTRDFLKAYAQMLDELERRQQNGPLADYKTKVDESQNFDEMQDSEFPSLVLNSQRGWMYAGFKWWDLSRATSFQLQLQQQKPTYVSYRVTQGALPGAIRKKLDEYSKKYYAGKSLRRTNEWADSLGDPLVYSDEFVSKYVQEYSSDFAGGWNLYKSKLGAYVSQFAIGQLYDFKNMDLLANLQNTGHNFLITGETLLLGAAAATVVSMGADIVGDVSGGKAAPAAVVEKLAGAISSTLLWIGIVFFVCGFVYAIYLPMLPAMIWTFGIIGWLEKLIALMIAFPAWMAGHVVPDGDGLVNGVGRQGYVLLASVLIRPPAMILSLHFAMAALGAVGFYLSDFSTIFIPSAQQGYVFGIFTVIGGLVVFSGFLVVVVHLILAWIYKIPDDLPLYISGGAGQFGESEGKGHLQGIGGVVSQKTEHGAGQAFPGGGSKNRMTAKAPDSGDKGGGSGGGGQQNASNRDFV